MCLKDANTIKRRVCYAKEMAVSMLVVSFVFMVTGCCIFHDWQEATCIEAKTCNKCGETEGEALGHSWEEAACTEPKTCSVCGETEGEALGHSWEEATCTEPKTCSVCRETEGGSEHDWARQNCKICGETIGKTVVNVDGVIIDIAKTRTDIGRLFENTNYKPSSVGDSAWNEGYCFAIDGKYPDFRSDEFSEFIIRYADKSSVTSKVLDFKCRKRGDKHITFYNNIKSGEDYYTVLSAWGDPDYTCNLNKGMCVYWRIYDSHSGDRWYIYGFVDTNRKFGDSNTTFFIEGISSKEPVPDYKSYEMIVDPYI